MVSKLESAIAGQVSIAYATFSEVDRNGITSFLLLSLSGVRCAWCFLSVLSKPCQAKVLHALDERLGAGGP
jgi:hypothetical protein